MDNYPQKNFRSIINNLKKSIQFITTYNKRFVFINIGHSIIQGIIPTLSLITMQRILNDLQKNLHNINVYLILIIIYCVLDIVSSLLSNGYNLYYTRFSMNFNKYIEIEILEKANKLSLHDFEDTDTYNTINRAENISGENILQFLSLFTEILQLTVTVGSSFIVLSRFKIGWIIIIVILIIPIISYMYTLKIAKISFHIKTVRTKEERNLWYINYLSMTGAAFKEIKVLGLKDFLLYRYKRIKEEIIKQDINIAKRSIKVQTILDAINQILSAAVFFYLIICGIRGNILIGDVVTYAKCIFMVKNNMETILALFSTVVTSALTISWLYDFMELPVQSSFTNKKVLKEKISSIRFENVSFRYKNNFEYALKNVSFTLCQDEIVAIVGKNGSGKSTLIKLLLYLYDDYIGEIYINNINLRNIDIESYYRKVSCVFQDFIKYETSLMENITYGNINDKENEDRIHEVLKFVDFNNKICEDEGLNIILGNWFGKKQLSLGEWQKVAIARGVFKDFDVCLMDEPDASLDVEAQNNILHMYKEIFNSKIGFFVTHKISNARRLGTKILVLDQGKIEGYGTHDQLMNYCKLYHDLYLMQEERCD